ncbi:MAG: insulinase family protein [Proteobacteria bacterium]|nr:insulinase family protein [Pseudomonadota bacterium]
MPNWKKALLGPAAICAGLSFSPLFIATAQAELFEAKTFTLKNGMEVVVLPRHLAPVVFQVVVYKVGAADGEKGKNGVAHFLEHLMFKATKKLKAGQFSQDVDRVGGTDNAFTNQDMTAFHQEFAAEHLPQFMAAEADRMVNLQLDDKVVLPERDVILNERGQTVESDPGSRLSEAMNAAIFQNHPYGLPIIGWRHEMETYTTQDAVDFYHRWYAPNNAILIIAGDVQPDEVKKLAEKNFGKLAARTIPARERLMEPPPEAARRLSLSSPEVEHPSVWRRYMAESYRTAGLAQGDNAPYALSLLSEVLGGGAVGRLYRQLVIESHVAISAGASYNGDARDYGSFTFYASPRDPAELAKAEAAIDTEIAKLLKDGITADELAAAKNRLLMEAAKARDSLNGPALLVAEALAGGETMDDIQSWPDRINAVTVDDVMTAAHAILTPENSVTSTLLPEATDDGKAPEAPAGAAPSGETPASDTAQ